MSVQSQWKKNDWFVFCAICSKRIFGSEAKMNWKNNLVCLQDYEPRHPSDMIRPPSDRAKPPYLQPDPSNTTYPTAENPPVTGGVSDYPTMYPTSINYVN